MAVKMRREKNGWEQTPRVRYAIHDFEGGDLINQPASEFPPKEVTNERYYLDGRFRKLITEIPGQDVKAGYDTESNPGLASFIVRFDNETVMVGYPKVHLYVEAEGSDDMDIFILLQKLDIHGNHLQQFIVPNQGAMMQDLTEHGGSVLRYKGSNGRLRVSAFHTGKSHASYLQLPIKKP